ncbi:MAG: zf-TFIIB domain-containing protein [Blastococcus sp.]|nr:zf-TFIIB domain-containing protein [Blastococcus sp.]
MDLTCPKCHGQMRNYERNGVHVDQCTECRGIFLDRGELDRLIDAENAWHGGGAAAEPRNDRDRDDRPRDDREPYERDRYAAPKQSSGDLGAVVGEVMRQVRGSKSSSHSSQQYGSRRKKESFLGDLFG